MVIYLSRLSKTQPLYSRILNRVRDNQTLDPISTSGRAGFNLTDFPFFKPLPILGRNMVEGPVLMLLTGHLLLGPNKGLIWTKIQYVKFVQSVGTMLKYAGNVQIFLAIQIKSNQPIKLILFNHLNQGFKLIMCKPPPSQLGPNGTSIRVQPTMSPMT